MITYLDLFFVGGWCACTVAVSSLWTIEMRTTSFCSRQQGEKEKERARERETERTQNGFYLTDVKEEEKIACSLFVHNTAEWKEEEKKKKKKIRADGEKTSPTSKRQTRSTLDRKRNWIDVIAIAEKARAQNRSLTCSLDLAKINDGLPKRSDVRLAIWPIDTFFF